MTAVTIAIGDLYKKFAFSSALLAKKMTGLNVKVITENDDLSEEEIKSPYLIKSRLFDFVDDDTILYFDADLMYIRPWNPLQFSDGKFYCVRDHIDGYTARADSNFFNLDCEKYFNSGFFIANYEKHQSFFKKTYQICRAFNNFKEVINQNLAINSRITPTYDQSIFNMVAQKTKLPIHFLNKRYNWLIENINSDSIFLKIDSFSIHYCSGKDDLWYNGHLKFILEQIKNQILIKWDESNSQNCEGKYLYRSVTDNWEKEIFLHKDCTISSRYDLQWEKHFCINEYDKTLIFFGKEEIKDTKDTINTLSANFSFIDNKWVGKFSENRVKNSSVLELIKIN